MPRATRSNKGKEKAVNTTSRSSNDGTRSRSVVEMFSRQAASQKKQETDTTMNEEEEEVMSDELEEEERGEDDSSESEVEASSSKRRRTAKGADHQGPESIRRQRKRGTAHPPTEVSISHDSQLLEQASVSDGTSFYDKVSSDDVQLDNVVAEWVSLYREDRVEALRKLVNFMIRSCGCMTAVTEEAFVMEDIAEQVLKELQEELAKLPQPEYPIISKSKSGKMLKRNILNFFQTLMNHCQHEIIYDGTFIETLQNWVTTTASSIYRPFRHTATILAFKIMDSLCCFADKIEKELAVVTRQLNKEQNANRRSRNSEKSRLLEQRSRTLQRKKTSLLEYLHEIFESVFVHRSRDVESIIRTESIKELCNWMHLYSQHFVDNQYLRYFGWALNDQHPTVRSESLKAIIRLYKTEAIAEKLAQFTERFKPRIIEIALYDVDISARIQAIELAHVLFKHNHNLIPADSRTLLMSLVTLDNARLRKAVAPFVKAVMDAEVFEPTLLQVQQSLGALSTTDNNSANNSNSVNTAWVFFKCIASFLARQAATEVSSEQQGNRMESDAIADDDEVIDDIVYNTVEALWFHMPTLQNYKAMSNYLCRDHSRSLQQQDARMDNTVAEIQECYRLTEAEETILVKVFTVCLRMIVERGLEDVSSRQRDKRKGTCESASDEVRNAMSRHLVQVLPDLLTRHNDNIDKTIKLITIPQLISLDVYAELRMQKTYEELLENVMKKFITASSPNMLEACAQTLQHMQNTSSLLDVNEKQFTALQEQVASQVRDICRGKDVLTCRFSRDEAHSLSLSLLRLDHLINFMDITDILDESDDMEVELIQVIVRLVDRGSFGYEEEKQVYLSAMAIAFRYIVWRCERISAAPDSEYAARLSIGKLERRRDDIVDKLTALVTDSELTPIPRVKSMAFGILMDFYWIFSSNLFVDGLNVLHLKCPEQTQTRCKEYIASEMKKWQDELKEKEAAGDDTQSTDNDESDNHDTEKQKEYLLLIANVTRAVNVRVLEYSHAVAVVSLYGRISQEVDEIIKALVEELKGRLTDNEEVAGSICQMYLESLKQSFEAQVNPSYRSVDKTLALARLLSQSVYQADQADQTRRVSSRVICDRLHVDGITYVLSKAGQHKEQCDSTAMGVALKFFRVLNVLVKPLTRARDVAKIHKHIDACLQQYNLSVQEDEKEWEGYQSYIKSIDQILKKKGLRYDAKTA